MKTLSKNKNKYHKMNFWWSRGMTKAYKKHMFVAAPLFRLYLENFLDQHSKKEKQNAPYHARSADNRYQIFVITEASKTIVNIFDVSSRISNLSTRIIRGKT